MKTKPILIILILFYGCQKSNKDKINITVQNERPNIVFLFADDWGKYASAYAKFENEQSVNRLIETPNFDKIASEGALFLNAFVPAPSCTPSRSSILSGQYFYRTGMGSILHGARWDDSIPTYPKLLEKAGYHIGFTYKVWSPGSPKDAPFGGKTKAYDKWGKNFNRFSHFVSKSENKDEAKRQLYKEVKNNFIDFLDDNTEGNPFCYWFGPTNTHRSWERGSGSSIWGLDPNRLKGKLPSFLPDTSEIREDFNDYLGEVLAWDKAVGVILDILKERGELENTIIVISGDHGIPGIPRAKTNLYDLGSSVALAISWPVRIKKGIVLEDMVNLMDLAPTFLEAGGVEIPKVMNGNSLLARLIGLTKKTHSEFVLTGRERHVAQAREGNLPYPQRAYRTKDFLYIRNFKPERWPIGTLENGLRDIDGGPTRDWYVKNYDSIQNTNLWNISFGKRPFEEFYDVRTDPYQTKNLAALEEYAFIKNKYAHKMDSILRETLDPRKVIDSNYFDKMPFIGENDFNIKQHSEIKQFVNRLYNENKKN